MHTKNLYESGPNPFFSGFFNLMGTRMVQLSQLLLNSAKRFVQHDPRVTIRHAACIRCGGILSRCIRSPEFDRIIARTTYCIRVQQYISMGT